MVNNRSNKYKTNEYSSSGHPCTNATCRYGSNQKEPEEDEKYFEFQR